MSIRVSSESSGLLFSDKSSYWLSDDLAGLTIIWSKSLAISVQLFSSDSSRITKSSLVLYAFPVKLHADISYYSPYNENSVYLIYCLYLFIVSGKVSIWVYHSWMSAYISICYFFLYSTILITHSTNYPRILLFNLIWLIFNSCIDIETHF